MEKKFKILLLILLLGIAFRFWNLETIPRWDWDEGENMNIAWNLANGRMQDFCIRYPFVPHPPLYFIIVAGILKLLGNDLIFIRGLSVFYGILTILLLYLIGKEMFNKKIGLLSAFLFAIYPTAIYWNRMGFANNQLMFLSFLALYCLLLCMNRKKDIWFYLAGILTGLSIITEILGFGLFFAISAFLFIYRRETLPKFIAISALIPALFVISMLLIIPDAFLHDLIHNSGRSNHVALIVSIIMLLFLIHPSGVRRSCIEYLYKIYAPVIGEIKNNLPLFYIILSLIVFLMPPSDEVFIQNLDYFWFGILGFYLIREGKYRDMLIYLFLSFFIILLWLNRSDHMIMPLYPLFCIGLAVLLDMMYITSLRYFSEKLRRFNVKVTILTIILVFYPLGAVLYYDVTAFIGGGFLSREDINARYKVADFVNNRVNAEDIVLTDSHLSRMINCKTSVLIQSATFEGKPIAYMPANLSKDRFLFNCSYPSSKFIVMVNGTKEWAMNQTALVDMVDEIQNWNYTEINNYIVYRNPQL